MGPLVVAGLLLAAADPLVAAFQRPPPAAHPQIWWHWLGGNVSREGITRDLDAMKRVGLGGFHLFDAQLDAPPRVVDPPVKFMSAPWLGLLRHAATEARRLGLEMTLHASAGWSLTGGPWVQPAKAMRKLVWSEWRVTGPTRLRVTLPRPPAVFGPFQGLAGTGATGVDLAEVAVVALPAPGGSERRLRDLGPRVLVGGRPIDARLALDGDPNTSVTVGESGRDVTVDVELPRSIETRTFTLFTVGDAPVGELRAATADGPFRPLAPLPGRLTWSRPTSKTFAFPAIAARAFRLVMKPTGKTARVQIAELDVGDEPRVHRFEDKAAFAVLRRPDDFPTPPTSGPSPAQVMNLTGRMDAGGVVEWDVPPGRWVMLRFGHSPTGTRNGPASPEGTGLECDKLDPAGIRAHLDGFLQPIAGALGPLLGDPIRNLLMDSWEANQQNWTPRMPGEFASRRGYELWPFLPVLAGHVVGSAEMSDRFLWDFRRTVADLVADAHYGAARTQLRARGLGLWAEAAGIGLGTTIDQIQAKGRVDVPMGEFWVPNDGVLPPAPAPDAKEAASAARVWGKRMAAAEAFTARPAVPAWSVPPARLKALGDQHYAAGINQLVLHQYAHQPLERAPGLTLGPFGTQFGRFVTWWDQSRAWIGYLTRTQALLQQGTAVADLLYFYGEGTPAEALGPADLVAPPPAGFDHDVVGAEALLGARAQEGRVVFPGAQGYRVLLLPATRTIGPQVLAKLRELVTGGVTLLGLRPLRAPGLAGQPDADSRVAELAAALWGPSETPAGDRRVGQGRVVWGKPLDEVLRGDGLVPDFTHDGAAGVRLVHTHRRIGSADLYFVANLDNRDLSVELSFRTAGRRPEIWDADRGTRLAASSWWLTGDRTVVPVRLEGAGSRFVVFREPGRPSRAQAETSAVTSPLPAFPDLPVPGPWQLRFPPGLGAPTVTMTVGSLASWTTHEEPGVRHFAGTATYTTRMNVPAIRGTAWVLDLGEVRELAEVTVNGRQVGLLWRPPFRVDVTRALRSGDNLLQVRVTNLWPNRLIGDVSLPAEQRVAWTSNNPYRADTPLLPSGLLGPVRLVPERRSGR